MLYAGENDLASGKTPEDVLADFQRLVDLVLGELPQTRICFLAIKPSPCRWEIWPQMQRANALIRDFTTADPRLGYIDIVPLMLDAAGEPRTELYSDNLHMTPEGYRLWVPVIREYL